MTTMSYQCNYTFPAGYDFTYVLRMKRIIKAFFVYFTTEVKTLIDCGTIFQVKITNVNLKYLIHYLKRKVP